MKRAVFLSSLIVISLIVVFVTYNYFVMFSAMGIGLLNTSIAICLWFAFDRFVLRGIDTMDEIIKKKNTALAIVLLAVAIVFSVSVASAQSQKCPPPHLYYAQTQVGVVEGPDNTGPEIATYLQAVGLDEGYPYCAAFVSKALNVGGVATPTVRSALATDFITSNSISTKYYQLKQIQADPGAILVFRRGNTKFGHTGFIVRQEEEHFITIEANTSPGQGGSQRDGQGVYQRVRSFKAMYPGNYFRATHVTPVRY